MLFKRSSLRGLGLALIGSDYADEGRAPEKILNTIILVKIENMKTEFV
jgi:hypothetical protein